MPDKFTAALVQNSYTSDRKRNIDKIIESLREAKKRGADFAALSELHNSLYFCQIEDTGHFDLAEAIPGESTELFGKISRDLGMVLLLSLFEKRAPGLYHNTAVIMEKDGTIAGKYRKMHIPDDPGFYEKFYFTPGDLGFQPIGTSLGKIGVLVCWDQWYPEAARLSAMAGSEVLVYPTAIGWDGNDSLEEKNRQLDAWITIQRSHAVANGIPVLAVNRTGLEKSPDKKGFIDFWGNSFAAGAQGEILAKAASDKEGIVIVEIDKKRTETVRRIWPFFRDRRIDQYQNLLKRYGNE